MFAGLPRRGVRLGWLECLLVGKGAAEITRRRAVHKAGWVQ